MAGVADGDRDTRLGLSMVTEATRLGLPMVTEAHAHGGLMVTEAPAPTLGSVRHSRTNGPGLPMVTETPVCFCRW